MDHSRDRVRSRRAIWKTGAVLDDAEIERLLGGAPRITIDDIVGHPRLPEARKLYLDRFLDVYGGDPFLVRLLIQSSRFILYNLVAVLEAGQDPRARRPGLPSGFC
jgi:hypothetical protein